MYQKDNMEEGKPTEQFCEQAGTTLKDFQPQQYPLNLKKRTQKSLCYTHTHICLHHKRAITEAC